MTHSAHQQLDKLQSRCQLTAQKKQKLNPIFGRINPCAVCVSMLFGHRCGRYRRRRLCLLSAKQAAGNTRRWNGCCSLPSQCDCSHRVTQQPPQGRAEPSCALLRCATVLPQFQPDRVTELISVTVEFSFLCVRRELLAPSCRGRS